MRLMEPSPGEACDRITILKLKIAAAEEKHLVKMVSAFKHEFTYLSQYLNLRHYFAPEDLVKELTSINSQLWTLEDEQRQVAQSIRVEVGSRFHEDLLSSEAEGFLKRALRILFLNDDRAATIQRINTACKVDAPEKLHYAKEYGSD